MIHFSIVCGQAIEYVFLMPSFEKKLKFERSTSSAELWALGLLELGSYPVDSQTPFGDLVTKASHLQIPEGQPYVSNTLLKTPSLEVILGHWSSIPCLPHDHAQATGNVFILSGQFTEQHFEWSEKNQELISTESRKFGVGEKLTISRGDIHVMECHSRRGVTLNIYRPEVNGMTIYDSSSQANYKVTNDCGAWKPKAHQIVDLNTWKSLN